MESKVRQLALITLLLLITACGSNRVDTFANPDPLQPTLPEFNLALFSNSVDITPIDAITNLNEEQQSNFFRYFNSPANQNTPPNTRAFNYLSLVVDQLNYSDETLTAEQTLTRQSGNCLSLTNLTKAIAKLANVDIGFQLLENNLVFGIQGDYLTRTDHIRAVLKGPVSFSESNNSNHSFSVRTNLRVDYFPTDNLRYVDGMTGSMQTSLYYSNLAVDFMIDNQYPQAFFNAIKALEVSPRNSSALNVMGLIHRRFGDQETAEKIFLYGAQHLRDKITFQRNYTVLLESQDRQEEAEKLSEKIRTVDDLDPWYWVRSGLREHQQGNFERAIEHFDRALAIAPDLDRVHFYAARAYVAADDKQKSEEHLASAIQHAQKSSIRGTYKAKLFALKTK